MSLQVTVRHLVLLGVFWPAARVTWAKVVQIPKYLEVNRGANASILCTFPLSQDMPDVRWWRRGEQSFLEPDNRKRFAANKGRSSLELLNVTFADSGVYYCKVKYLEKSTETGTGTQLTVYVPPTPLKIVRNEESSATSLRFECKTAAFYPEGLNISWRRDGVEILAGIQSVRKEAVDGLFEVTSSLEETRPLQNRVVYTCLASHISLKMPASVNCTVNQGKQFPLIFGCASGALAVVLLIIILTRLKLKASAGVKRNSLEAGQSDETTKQRGDNKLTYATLQLAHFKKASKFKQEDKHVEYAEINMTKREKLKI